MQRLAELADFYGVPVGELLPDAGGGTVAEAPPRLVIDLEALGSVPAERAGPLARYAATIQGQRGDYNGKVLSIRAGRPANTGRDLRHAAGGLADELITWGVLDADARRAVEATMHPESDTGRPAWTHVARCRPRTGAIVPARCRGGSERQRRLEHQQPGQQRR